MGARSCCWPRYLPWAASRLRILLQHRAGSHLLFMWPWLHPRGAGSTPHCALAPPPVVVLALPRILALPHTDPTVPEGQPHCSGGCPRAPTLGLGQRCLQVPRVVAQVPRGGNAMGSLGLGSAPEQPQQVPGCQPHMPLSPGKPRRAAHLPAPHHQSTARGLPLESPVGLGQGHGVGQNLVPCPHQALQDVAVLPAEGTAQGGRRRRHGVPGTLEQGRQEGPDKHLASVFIYRQGYLYRKVL